MCQFILFEKKRKKEKSGAFQQHNNRPTLPLFEREPAYLYSYIKTF